MVENEYRFISFLNKKSLFILNEIAKKGRVKYVKRRIKKPAEEPINYDKLMREKPGFNKGDNEKG